MPPAKKPQAAATSRAKKSSKSGQASTIQDAPAEKAGSKQEKQPPAQKRGRKRDASELVDAQEDQAVEDKPRAGKSRSKTNKIQKVADTEDGDELSESQLETVAPEPAKKRRRQKLDVKAEIPETQPPEIEIPETQRVEVSDIISDEEEMIEEQSEEPSTYHGQGVGSVQRHQSRSTNANQKAASNSDTDLNEPNLRRRIGELTRQFQALEAKYRDLKEIGAQEAERNFDRLKKQNEERANTDKQLIATLRAQLANETEAAKTAVGLRTQLEESQQKIEELEEKLKGANSALVESKTEIKTLSTKLAAARSAEPANAKVPGSAIKKGLGNNRHNTNASDAAQLAQKKENLYGDLTGLLVCGIRQERNEEVFDCVQTGRNGTLHFKLAIGTEGSSESFDDAQFMYMPQLDAARDQELVDTLPDYLVEEITFPRLHAAKFYARVVKALSDRPE